MKELFKSIVDTKFTAEMEKDLDRVGDGETYVKALEDFTSRSVNAYRRRSKNGG